MSVRPYHQNRFALKNRSILCRDLRLERLEDRAMMAVDISVIDANTLPLAGITQSTFNGQVEVGGKIFFRDTDPQFGAELFEYDPGTDAKRRVTDWNPGFSDSMASLGNFPLIAKTSTALFVGITSDTAGSEIGFYDTVTGSSRVIDALGGISSSYPRTINDVPGNAVVVGNKLYFVTESLQWIDYTQVGSRASTLFAPSNTAFRELTVVGTKLFFTSQVAGVPRLSWIDTASASPSMQTISLSNPMIISDLRAVGSRLYFVVHDLSVGSELRWIDTTLSNPTVNTIDLVPGTSSGGPSSLVVLSNKLYFKATTSTAGTELRWIEPAVSNAVQTLDIFSGTSSGNPSSLVSLGNRLYFLAFESTLGSEIRWIDSTLSVPVLQTIDSVPGANGRFYEAFVTSNEYLFGLTNTFFDTSKEPIVVNAMAANPTVTVVDALPGPGSSNPAHLLALGSRLYFGAEVNPGRELTWLDAAVDPNVLHFVDVRDTLGAAPYNYYVAGDKVFFAGQKYYSGRNIGWFSTKTMTPEVHFLDINAGSTPYFYPSFTQVENKLFFISDDDTYGAEVSWIDLNDPGMTVHTLDVRVGPEDSFPANLVRHGSRLFWTSYEPITGKELRWVDATLADPVVETVDISTTAFWGDPQSLEVHGDSLYFTAFDNTYGLELRRINTSQPTWTIETYDVNPGSVGSSVAYPFATLGDRLYFVASDAIQGEKLRWIDTTSSSTTFNTVLLGDVNEINWMVPAGNRLYFRGKDATRGNELRWIDTTLANPVLNTIDFSPNIASTEFEYEYPVVVGNKMYLAARNFLGEMELRWIDTTSTTNLLNTLDLAIGPSNPRDFAVIGNQIYLSADDSFAGREMIVISPLAGPSAFSRVDLTAGNQGSFPRYFFKVGNRLYFAGFKLGANAETYIYSSAVAPTNVQLSSANIAENSPIGSTVGSFQTSDANSIEEFQYELVAGTGDQDNASFAIVGSELRTNTSLNFENKSQYSIRVKVTDIDGLTFEKNLTIQIVDMVEEVFAQGTPGADQFEATLIGPNLNLWQIKVNGAILYSGLASMVSTVFFDGLDGTDTFQVIGTANADTIQANGNEFFLNGHRSFVTDVETLAVRGEAGNDALTVTSTFLGNYDGGLGVDSIQGPDLVNQWNITALNRGSLNANSLFINVETTIGGLESDQFTFQSLGKLSGKVHGGAGQDTADQSLSTLPITINAQLLTATNTGGWSGVEEWRGSVTSNRDTWIGRNIASSYVITGMDQGIVNSTEFQFSNFENVTGGTLSDSFSFADEANSIRGILNGGSGIDSVSWNNWTTPLSLNLATKTAPGAAQFAGFESYTGSTFADSLVGPATNNTWQITGLNQGLVGATQFSGFENLLGNLAADSFRIIGNTSSISGTVQGGSGLDSIVGPNQPTTWNISGGGELVVSSTQFSGIENITGGTSNDFFVIESTSSSIPGTLSGGTGVDTLSWALLGTPIQVNLATFQASQVGRFSAVEHIEGSTADDLIIGPNASTAWQIQGPNEGLAGTMQFSSIESAQGGSGNDSFRFIGATATLTNGINGGDGLDTLTGPDLATSWNILGFGSGLLGATNFGGIENLTGGTLNDVFEVSPTGSIAGALSGGNGVNTLSYANWSSDVTVNLSVMTSGNATVIGGTVSKIQIVQGGDGNDSLIGAVSLPTLLLGNGGNDLLQGGAGRDLLFGGSGIDQVLGASGEDLIIAGTTSYDSDLSSLILLHAEWTSTRTFASRVANLKGLGSGIRLNGNTFLDASTVFADLEADQLTGGLNNDWFWSNPSEGDRFVEH